MKMVLDIMPNNEYNIKRMEYTQLFIHIIIYTYQYTHKLREGATV